MKNLKKSSDPSQILKCFFAKNRDELERDLERVRFGFHPPSDGRLARLMNYQSGRYSAEAVAHSFHLQLCDGVALWHDERLHEDLRLVAVTLPAQQLAEMACVVASGSGELAEIHFEMLCLDRDLGLSEEETLSIDEMPPDYLKLAERSHQLLARIYETVLVQILERYGVNELGVLFETQRVEFEVRYEVGRRLLNPAASLDQEEEAQLVDSFREEFGEPSVEKLVGRLAEHGLV